MQLKLAPVLALALPALVFGAADANIRGSQESYTSIRELSSDSTNEETTTLSGGTWLFYVMLNTLMYPVDASGHGCNSAHYSSSTTTGKGDGHSTSWANDGHTRLLENAWNGDSYSYSGNSWGGDSHQTTSSSSKPKPKPKPPRCEAPHAPKPKPKPKKSSSSSSHSWGGDNWGSDAWGSDAWENDGHTSSSYTSSQLAYNDDSGGSGAIAGAFVSLMVAVVAAALVAKKKFGSRKVGSIDGDALADTDDNSDGADKRAAGNYLEMTDNGVPPPPAKPSKLSQWRSAIDAASGKTYYYMKGTKITTWKKPNDF